VPFLQVNMPSAPRRASPLLNLKDVVHPLDAAGLLAATLAASPRKWRGVMLLPWCAEADVIAGPTNGPRQAVGHRMRDMHAGRGKNVRLDLR
jgi:hypothetical protein